MSKLPKILEKFNEKFGQTIMETDFKGTKFYQWTVSEKIKTFLTTEFTTLIKELVEEMGEIKGWNYCIHHDELTQDSQCSICQNRRTYNLAMSEAQEILRKEINE